MEREYLVRFREQRNESQQDVATALNISRQYYLMIENGQRQKRMDVVLVAALANHFGVPITDIVACETDYVKEVGQLEPRETGVS